jgi:alkylhydroperoxidase/carboxymuconolactone decarboxylase family protein YurZ
MQLRGGDRSFQQNIELLRQHYRVSGAGVRSKSAQIGPDHFLVFSCRAVDRAYDKVALEAGSIPKKYKELMAIAVALTTQCPYCIEVHRKQP